MAMILFVATSPWGQIRRGGRWARGPAVSCFGPDS